MSKESRGITRHYTEMQVLKKLDIPDFRHLTKDKVIEFATMVPRMNPEVAKKALEQFPNFASTSLDVMKEYRTILEKSMDQDQESAQVCYDMYGRVMAALEKILEEDNLTFEEKTYILSEMKQVADEVSRKDLEKTNARMKVISIASGVAAAVVAILGTAIGVNLTARQNDITDGEDYENKDI